MIYLYRVGVGFGFSTRLYWVDVDIDVEEHVAEGLEIELGVDGFIRGR